MNPISTLSPGLIQQRLTQLAKLIPEAFSEGKLDVAALKRVLGETEVIESGERYRLDWAGKTESYKVLQAPSSATLRPERDKSSINFDSAPHVFIEGENLEVLKVLQKSYFGKVKLIYIDPPYNTGSDSFVYPDRFQESKEDYLRHINELNDDGSLMREGAFRKNNRENGHYHSNWLSMMLPRLSIARNLLREDGVIFVSIDDNEVHNLRCLMNEVFGEENFVSTLIWERAYAPKNDAKYISCSHDYILMYARSIDNFQIGRLQRTAEADARYKNPDNDPRGAWKPSDMSVKTYNAENDYPITTPSGRVVEPPAGRCWSLSKKSFLERLQENRIYFGEEGKSVPCIKRFLTELKFEGMAPTSILFYKEVGHSQEGAKEVTSLLKEGIFDGPKPARLMSRLLKLANTNKDSIILDFFAGSSSTAHAVMQANYEDSGNRQFIMVQLPEKCAEDSSAFKAGYSTIADISRQRIRKVIQQIEKEQSSDLLNTNNSNLGFKSFVLAPSNFKQWRGDHIETAEQLVQQIELFTQPEKDGATTENILFELLLRLGQPLTTPIEILDMISHQPSAISHQPSAISHQPSAISHQPSAISKSIRYKSEKHALCA